MRTLAIVTALFAAMFFSASAAFSQGLEDVPKITIDELKQRIDSGEYIAIVDTRARGEYHLSNIKIAGAIDIPLLETEARIAELPFGLPVALYCT